MNHAHIHSYMCIGNLLAKSETIIKAFKTEAGSFICSDKQNPMQQ